MKLPALRGMFLASALLCMPAAGAQPDPLTRAEAASSASPAAVAISPQPLRTALLTPAGNSGLTAVFYLAVLAVLALPVAYLARSGWVPGMLRKSVPRKLQVSEVRPLGNRQFLVVAEYETTRLLLGVSQGRIDLLCHLGKEDGDVTGEFPALLEEPPPREAR